MLSISFGDDHLESIQKDIPQHNGERESPVASHNPKNSIGSRKHVTDEPVNADVLIRVDRER